MKKRKIFTLAVIVPLLSAVDFLKLDIAEYMVPRPAVVSAEIADISEPSVENPPDWLEEYTVGVVASEMPVFFDFEALKAQAVASRTYAYRAYCNNKSVSFEEIGQVYTDNYGLKNKWGENYEKYYALVKKAVEETKNELLFYNDEPILAVFSSASGGVTESCKNAWGCDLPYLQSVSSDYDKNAPVFYDRKNFSLSQIKNIFSTENITSANTYIVKRSEADYVQEVIIGGKILSGHKLRSALGLKSGNFNIEIKGENMIFETKGYGHGVGMSQYGAEFMARNGYNYREILTHYYSGADIIKVGSD